MKYDFSKMKKTEVGGGNFIKYPECKPGQVLVQGEYLGEVPNKFNPAKPNFRFKNNDGSILTLPASGQLNSAFSAIESGTLVSVTFLGKEKITKGSFAGKEANSFKIEVFSEDSQDAPTTVQIPLGLDNLE